MTTPQTPSTGQAPDLPPVNESAPLSAQPVGREGSRVNITERKAWAITGLPGIVLALAFLAVGIWLFLTEGLPSFAPVLGVVLTIIGLLLFSGLAVVSPGQTRVVQFFGAYVGTVRRTGLVMTVPLSTRQKVSVKVNNFETNELKVNDSEGNPVNIAAIIVWQVADTAKSVFAVEKAAEFVAVQSESALRHIAGAHPYDNGEPGAETLRGATEKVADELADEVAARIAIAGLEVIEARISSLAYAPEIAQAMLQRQQASAVIAAREKIVEGAVTMVQNALNQLEEQDIVTLDNERKAAMVSNLLVVLCSDSHATPVVNAGSLYN
ncbi:SPFH domain-containing protein [Propionibacterium freudenreichii]|uniref:SPFH domain/Band 7 n=1 Tax=Propionibacterium freudenreichii TaxID=1744 RepID=A0A2C8A936_9ACTN|nr:SPFH domain-containing protein [Propionibacterium freudenreichii]CEI31916.1 Membrane protease subunits, stomatin/prohibitin homologs (Membrane protease subunit, stomatin/prohibitin homolog) [Propionibacterium freudenreichii]CUW17721.1 SPFH domain/Band 7 family protein [Propionibacterium freudenreichii subsp. shermanii]SBN40380.1 SPFH domain/Band 7 [Propionibacterium freudenreichii]SCQ55084.1 SPFH domain/Band 7 [Propionibacterium freudenreichii]SCQ57744.1 SPFH domain/Band 7 [Propionibacteriu